MVRTRTRSPEEMEGAKEGPEAVAVAIAITRGETTPSQNMHLQEKMKDSPISKLTITKAGHRPTQFKKITDTLPVLCADKNFQGLDEVLWTKHDLVEMDFMPPYLDANQWSTTHHVQVSTVNPNDAADRVTGKRPVHFQMMEQTHIFDANLQLELLSEYECDSKNKS